MILKLNDSHVTTNVDAMQIKSLARKPAIVYPLVSICKKDCVAGTCSHCLSYSLKRQINTES